MNNNEELDKILEAPTTMEEDSMDKQAVYKQISHAKKALLSQKKSAYFDDIEDSVIEGSRADMSKEYAILSEGNSYATKVKMTALYTFVGSILEADQADLLDLPATQLTINTHFKFLLLKKRFNEISKHAPIHIGYDYNGFYVGEATFETLDEVEKAVANKAFL